MPSTNSDVLILGATGFTGRLITRYLAAHPQRSQFTFTVSGRSSSKLEELVKDLGLDSSIPVLKIDVSNEEDIKKAVEGVKVVINTVGPYLRWGTKVVRACVRAGVHYVDLSGETAWIKDIITEFDYFATKTGAIIVPGSGFDSVPSDLSTFISSQTLHSSVPYGDELSITSSTTGHDFSGGISGGTISSALTVMSELPPKKAAEASMPYALSPVKGWSSSKRRLIYKLFAPGSQPLIGAYFFMRPVNKAIIERTFGLLQLADIERRQSGRQATNVQKPYGLTFKYDEFAVMPSLTRAIIFLSTFIVSIALFAWVPPVRWLVTKWCPPGSGPSEEVMQKGYLVTTNVVEAAPISASSSAKPVTVKTVMKCRGDPGYSLTAVLIAECALCFILPSTSRDDSSASSTTPKHVIARQRLPELAQKGGVLTPVTAFGDIIAERLKASGRVEIGSEVVQIGREVVARRRD
ncbi:hypothetical protein AX16_001323 [Volvariella volvacea WC 439]|nr:hypothetical protein AX16_001323 [Volvariella volvacea WC 439]